MTELATTGDELGPGSGARTIAQHSSESNEHYTPRAIVEAARRTMGEIDFDPFSCARANEVVQARAFCSLERGQNALFVSWRLEPLTRDDGGTGSRVFCNPPGGKLDRKSLLPVKGPGYSSAAVAWAKLIHEWKSGNVEQAIFVGFNLEILRTSQEWKERGIPSAGEFPLCFPDERLRFWNENKPEEKSDPTCANVIAYVPPRSGGLVTRAEHGRTGAEIGMNARDFFVREFSPFGTVRV
jgi:hypothetical protein